MGTDCGGGARGLFAGAPDRISMFCPSLRACMVQRLRYADCLNYRTSCLKSGVRELLRMAPVIQLVLFIIQDITILFNVIIIFLMFFNTFVFQAGLVNLLFHKFKGTIVLSAAYLALSISFHVWVMNLRWKNSNYFIWTNGLQTLFVFQRLVAVLYYYFYKRTAVHLGDPRFYQDSLWLRKEFAQVHS